MKLYPHLSEALDKKNGPKDGSGKSDGKGPATSNPLAAKMNFANKAGPLKAPPPNNSNQTGISIAKGSYLNTNSSNQQPTWKQMMNEP